MPQLPNIMDQFDVNRNATMQLNTSKVPAQDGVFSLVISAGGTGADALLETKGLINRTCCLDAQNKDKPTDHVAYLAFDTDANTLVKSSSKETGGVALDGANGEFVQMQAPNIGAFLAPQNRHLVPEYIKSWLDFSINPQNGQIGAGGVRQCGRLLLFQNVGSVRSAIDLAIHRLVARQKVDAMNIYLLSGIAGGTGSGTFVDLAYIAREVAEQIVPAKVTMYGYLFLPDVNLSRPMPPDNQLYSKKNGYAALKELDYLTNMYKDGGEFIQRYSPTYVIQTSMAPFHYTHLVSSMGNNGFVPGDPYRHGMRAVAQSICSFVAQEQKAGVANQFAMSSHYSNIANGTAQHVRKFPERDNSYLALGTFNYELPIDHILLYVTSLLFEKMDGMFANEPVQKDIDEAYHTLGLTPQSLRSELIGRVNDFIPPNLMWDDLFGPNFKYNLTNLFKTWQRSMEPQIDERVKRFADGFEEMFRHNSEVWFTDPERGPIWLNHLITLNDQKLKGLEARLNEDFNTAGGEITSLASKAAQSLQSLQTLYQEGNGRRGKKQRNAITDKYVEEVRRYADFCIKHYATVEMQKLYKDCRDIVRNENNRIFNVVVNVLQGLKNVCQTNANILTQTHMNQKGNHFTWQPLSIPDVAPVIQRAFNARGNAQQTIADFSKALYQRAYEWTKTGVNVKSFIQDYLDENLADIANCSLEDYVQEILQGTTVQDSVATSLGTAATTTAVPLLSVTPTADTGSVFWLLSVPYCCPNILKGFEQYRASAQKITSALTIQPSGIRNRIFAQSILSAVPLSSYAPLADYEQIYLKQDGDSGKHLFMGEQENWTNLPCPIPYRSRVKKVDAYPAAIQATEDKQRELFRRCRELPIIRVDQRNGQTIYELYIAELPELKDQFGESRMRGPNGQLDAALLQQSIDVLKDWLTNGLPDRALTDGVFQVCYPVATCAVPVPGQSDTREEDAQESFLGEYNNIRRARAELKKYRKVQETLAGLEKLHDQVAGAFKRVKRLVELLISGVVTLVGSDLGDWSYQYSLNGKMQQLVDVTETWAWCEAALSDALDAMSEDPQPIKRQAYEKLVADGAQAYKQMGASQTREEKKKLLKMLLEAVEARHSNLVSDLMNGIAPSEVTQDMVAFYEMTINYLKREIRNLDGPGPNQGMRGGNMFGGPVRPAGD